MLTRTRNIESEGMISHRGAVLIRARATYCSNQRPDIRTQLTLKMSGKAKAGRLQITRCTYMCAPCASAGNERGMVLPQAKKSACEVSSCVPPEKGHALPRPGSKPQPTPRLSLPHEARVTTSKFPDRTTGSCDPRKRTQPLPCSKPPTGTNASDPGTPHQLRAALAGIHRSPPPA